MSENKPSPLSVAELEQKIRDHVNKPRLQNKLIKDPKKWASLCSALDAIGDAEVAISSYLSEVYPEDIGQRYLITYGILQILYMEQTSAITLRKSFHLEGKLPDEIEEISTLRHSAIGHPTTNGGGAHFIARITLSKGGFNLMSTHPNKQSTHTKVDLLKLIEKQQNILRDSLQAVLDEIVKEESDHKQKFKGELLRSLFPRNINYYFQKIHEGISHIENDTIGIGDIGCKCVRDVFEKFKAGMEAREIIGTIPHIIEDIEYSLGEIEKFFLGELSSLPARAVRIFTDDLERKFLNLEEIAESIDKDYII